MGVFDERGTPAQAFHRWAAYLVSGDGIVFDLLQGHLAHKKHPPVRLCSRNVPRVLWWSLGGRLFIMNEVSSGYLVHTMVVLGWEVVYYERGTR